MATIRPFRALRFDEAIAGPLAGLVAPPYDVISDEQREEYKQRSPHNVVRLTLPDSEEQAARDLAGWREDGVLVEEAEPSYWWLTQEYVGPDGVARTREGFVAALRTEPYENRVILPHERTHAGPKEGRLRLLEATRTQLEPIFLLWDGSIALDGLGEPDLTAAGGRRHRTALAARRRFRRRPHRRARGRPAADRRRPPPLRDDARSSTSATARRRARG